MSFSGQIQLPSSNGLNPTHADTKSLWEHRWLKFSHSLILISGGRAGLSNGHYGHGPRGPCALGAQERRRRKNLECLYVKCK